MHSLCIGVCACMRACVLCTYAQHRVPVPTHPSRSLSGGCGCMVDLRVPPCSGVLHDRGRGGGVALTGLRLLFLKNKTKTNKKKIEQQMRQAQERAGVL